MIANPASLHQVANSIIGRKDSFKADFVCGRVTTDATSVDLATREERGPFRLQLERSPSSRLTNEYEYRVRPKSGG